MRHGLLSLALAGALALPAGGAGAGAWTQKAGEGQVIVTGLHSASDKGFDGAGDLVESPDYRKTTVEALVEYGLSDRTTLMVKPQFRQVDIGAPVSDEASGLGLSEVGARYRFTGDDGWVGAVQSSVFLPGGPSERARVAQAGADETEAEVRALAGRSFTLGGRDGFVGLEGGYRWRDGDPPNEWRGDVTVGWRPRPRVLLLGQLFNVVSDGAGQGGYPDYRYHNAEVSVVLDLSDRWSVQAGALATVAGENALKERGVVLAIWRRF